MRLLKLLIQLKAKVELLAEDVVDPASPAVVALHVPETVDIVVHGAPQLRLRNAKVASLVIHLILLEVAAAAAAVIAVLDEEEVVDAIIHAVKDPEDVKEEIDVAIPVKQVQQHQVLQVKTVEPGDAGHLVAPTDSIVKSDCPRESVNYCAESLNSLFFQSLPHYHFSSYLIQLIKKFLS
jgi:hypothetical protein